MANKKYYHFTSKVLETLPAQYQKLEKMPKPEFSKSTLIHSIPSKFLNTKRMSAFPMYKPISKII